MPAKYTPEQRVAKFWARVLKDPAPDGCWFRIGGTTDRGYGLFWDGQRQNTAHRFAYEATYGPVPDGLFVCHRCDNPACVRPDHLFTGTAKENTHDMIDKGRAHQTFSVRPDVIPSGDDHYTRRSPELVRRGEKAPSSKLTADQVRTIRERHAAGETQRSLAAEYGVCVANLHRIVTRKIWQHI